MRFVARAIGILLLVILPALCGGCGQRLAASYDKLGDSKRDSGDLDGALVEYNHAIALDPKDVHAYENRGEIKQIKGDMDGALADFNRAVETAPNDPAAYDYRGAIKLYTGDNNGAIEDCSHAIKLDPENADAFQYRGDAEENTGDFDGAVSDLGQALKFGGDNAEVFDSLGGTLQAKGDPKAAMADFDRAVALDPDGAAHLLYRGAEKFILRQWTDAEADFRKACDMQGEEGDEFYQDYGHIWLWMTRSRLGETDAATKELADWLAKRKAQEPNLWAAKVADCLLGNITEEQLMAAAAGTYRVPDPDQKCEAFFYPGMKKLLTGDKTGAADDFRKCVGTGHVGAQEYQMAQAELKALAQ